MKVLFLALVIGVAATVSGCTAPGGVSAPAGTQSVHQVKVVAINPGGGQLAEAVGAELARRGFRVVDLSATAAMLVRLGLNEAEIARPEVLWKIREEGIDALLVVRGTAGPDGQLQSASARMSSTRDGQVLADVAWQSGLRAQGTSIMERLSRKGLPEAASDIAGALAERLR